MESVRSQSRHLALVDRVRESVAPALGHDAERENSLVVASAMRELPELDQEILRLHVWEDLSSKQIATVLGKSPNATRVRLHRARKRLAALLEGLL